MAEPPKNRRAYRTAMSLLYKAIASIGKTKVFCIGDHKTGKSTLIYNLKELGFVVGDQKIGELLVHDWSQRNFRRIIWYCRTAQVFQDIPFGKAFTYVVMDQTFPKSKFILTVRDDEEQWYESYVTFHKSIFGGKLPTFEDLLNSNYVYPGWMAQEAMLDCPEIKDDLYNKQFLVKRHVAHNENVKEYFRHRRKDLLVLNVFEKGAYQKACEYLNKKPLRVEMQYPWMSRPSSE
jgi:hypothetical protein